MDGSHEQVSGRDGIWTKDGSTQNLSKCRMHTSSSPLFFMDVKNIKNQIPISTVKSLPNDLDLQIKKAAKMYEQQFLQEMMRAMRKTVEHSELTKPSMAEKIYQDEMQAQYTEKWVESGGNGLADLIYKEIKEKILPSQYSRYVQPQAVSKIKKEEK